MLIRELTNHMKETLCNYKSNDDSCHVNCSLCFCVFIQSFIWPEEFLIWTFTLCSQLMMPPPVDNVFGSTCLLEDLYSSNLHFLLWSSLNATAMFVLERQWKSKRKRKFVERRRNKERDKLHSYWVHQTISLDLHNFGHVQPPQVPLQK